MHCAQLPASGKGAASVPPGWGWGGCVVAGWHAACGEDAYVWCLTPGVGLLFLPGCFCWPPPPPPPRKPAFIVAVIM